MRGIGKKLPPRKCRAVLALLQTSSVAQAAKAAKVSEATLWRWLNDPDFQSPYRDAKRRVVEQALARLQACTGQAVDALLQTVSDVQSPPSTRVTAAKAILEQAVKAVELENLLARVEALENAIFHK